MNKNKQTSVVAHKAAYIHGMILLIDHKILSDYKQGEGNGVCGMYSRMFL